MRIDEAARQVRRQRVCSVETQVGTPLFRRNPRDQRVGFLEEGAVRQRERRVRVQSLGLDEIAPGQRRVGLVQLAHRQDAVGDHRVTQLQQGERSCRQPFLDGQDRIGLGCRCGASGERQDALDVAFVGGQQQSGIRVLAQVVLAVAQAQSSLIGVGDAARRVLEVVAGAEVEQNRNAARVQFGERRGDIACLANLVDARQQRFERRNAGRFHGAFVHAAGVERAEQAFHPVAAGGGLLQQAALLQQALQPDFLERAPACETGGYRVVAQPAAVGVLVEVGAGRCGGVEAAGVQRDIGRCAWNHRTTEDQGQRGRNQVFVHWDWNGAEKC